MRVGMKWEGGKIHQGWALTLGVEIAWRAFWTLWTSGQPETKATKKIQNVNSNMGSGNFILSLMMIWFMVLTYCSNKTKQRLPKYLFWPKLWHKYMSYIRYKFNLTSTWVCKITPCSWPHIVRVCRRTCRDERQFPLDFLNNIPASFRISFLYL